MDLFTDWLPLEAVLGTGKRRLLCTAREHGARAKDALARLSTRAKPRREEAKAAGPTPPFGLRDEDITLLDRVSGDVEFWLADAISRWNRDSRKLQESVADMRSSMHEQRRRLEIRLADITREYEGLIRSA